MPQLHNPYTGQQSFGTEQPASLPTLPFDKPVSEAGREALRLHQLAQEATARLKEARDASTTAAIRLRDARQAFQTEIGRGAREGRNEKREEELSLELAAAERLAEPSLHQYRNRQAVAAQRAAVQAYNIHAWETFPELLDELRPEAELVAAELQAALEKVAPIQERYRQIAERVRELTNITAAGEHAQDLAQLLRLAGEPQAPLPSDDALAAFERARQAPVVLDEEAVRQEAERQHITV